MVLMKNILRMGKIPKKTVAHVCSSQNWSLKGNIYIQNSILKYMWFQNPILGVQGLLKTNSEHVGPFKNQL